MPAKPLLLLDIDGCLSPLLPDNLDPQPPYVRLYGKICVHRSLPDWLVELRHGFSLVWATTWGNTANLTFGPLLGLPALPAVNVISTSTKFASICDHLKDDSAAWVDDQISKPAMKWARQRDKTTPTLFLPVEREHGMLRPDVDRLLLFAKEIG